MTSGKWRPSRIGLNVLTVINLDPYRSKNTVDMYSLPLSYL